MSDPRGVGDADLSLWADLSERLEAAWSEVASADARATAARDVWRELVADADGAGVPIAMVAEWARTSRASVYRALIQAYGRRNGG